VTETVVSGETGVFYESQTAESLADGVRRFETLSPRISAEGCRGNALRFQAENFRRDFKSFVEGEIEKA
jgi:hypothetical protein